MQSIHLQLSAELLARVDQAAGDVPRNRWIRRAIEAQLQALSGPGDVGASQGQDTRVRSSHVNTAD